jgi:hypothetical protein
MLSDLRSQLEYTAFFLLLPLMAGILILLSKIYELLIGVIVRQSILSIILSTICVGRISDSS